MEQIANLHFEKLPEGVYLATCEDIPGLIAQGRTITEMVELPVMSQKNCWRHKPNGINKPNWRR